ncbi:MAG: TonB-dependent receptor domain-containing protein [Cellulophaga sp.]
MDFANLAYKLKPNAPALYDDEGNLNWENNTFDNPLAELEREYQARTNTLIANTVLSYQLFPGLELKTNLGYTTYQLESYATIPNTSFNPSSDNGKSSKTSTLTTNSSSSASWIVEPQLNWQQEWGNASLNVLLGSTFQKQSTLQNFQKGTNFSSNILIRNLAAAEIVEVFQDSNSEYAYQAFFGRFNFNWKDKYIFNLTGRRDGSSRFGSGRQFGNFGAIGGAWLFSEEDFLEDSSIFSFGKLRGSFGTTGSDNIGDYKFLDTYDVTGNDYNGITVLEPTGIFNPNYAWEENKKLEIALELGFFKDRVLLNTAWYQNRSSNQLIGIPLATTTGFESVTGNFDATVQNTGFEVDASTTNIQSEHFKWTTTFNITIPKNKLLKFDGLESSPFANTYRIGKPLTESRRYHALGVDPETGLYQFEDYNNDGIISLDDKQWFTDFAPKFYGGIGNTLTYKNVSLEVFFLFKKRKSYNYFAVVSTPGSNWNAPVELYNRWQEPGDMATIQVAGGSAILGRNQNSSNAGISDASFVRLRNISLNYKIPKTVNFGMDINLYVQGQNLLTITNYKWSDPERPSDRLPPLQQITLGIQLGF